MRFECGTWKRGHTPDQTAELLREGRAVIPSAVIPTTSVLKMPSPCNAVAKTIGKGARVFSTVEAAFVPGMRGLEDHSHTAAKLEHSASP